MRRRFSVASAGWLFALFGAMASALASEGITPESIAGEPPKHVLFVGNSYLYYNDSLHNHVRRMVAADDPALGKSLRYKSATIGGSPLGHHDIRHLLKPGQLGNKQPFDVVILQENSTSPLSDSARASFREKAREFDAEIRKRGARTALYMTHAHVEPSRFASADMIRKIEDMYVSVGKELGALVIPVGLAFERAYRQKPDIQLHQDYDGSHPSLAGTYLAACVVYAALYGRSPVGNSYDYFGRIDQATATFLQEVAAETVDAFSVR